MIVNEWVYAEENEQSKVKKLDLHDDVPRFSGIVDFDSPPSTNIGNLSISLSLRLLVLDIGLICMLVSFRVC